MQEKEEKLKIQEKEEKSKTRVVEEDIAFKEMTGPTTREAEELAKAKELEKQEEICKLSRALSVLASASVRLMLTEFVSSDVFFFNACFVGSINHLWLLTFAVSEQGATRILETC